MEHVAHGSSLLHWLRGKVQGLVRVYSCCILVNEHMCQQVQVLHAVDGPHAPPVLTILHATKQD